MQEKSISIKITLLGDSGVGKSSIILRYNLNTFQEDFHSTNGANYTQKKININDINYQLDIWDTAGQEKYRSLGRNFYRDAYIVILVYDIIRKDSFDNLKNIWYPELLKYGEKFKILAVVGNKCDRYEEETVNEDEGRAFANEIKAIFVTTSAKTGNNIKYLFDTLIDLYIKPDFQDNISTEKVKRRGSCKIKKNTKEEEKEKEKEKKKKNCC